MSQFRGDVPNVEVSTFLASAAVTANYPTVIFIADREYEVVEMREVHTTASSDATPPTLNVELLSGTTAPGSGTVISIGSANLHGTANTIQTIPCGNTVIGKGQRLALKQTTTPTACVGVSVSITLRPV